jgi:dihydropteroate synthase
MQDSHSIDRQTLSSWKTRSTFQWGKQTYLMGVLNITPDSFSDGGQYNSLAAAVQRAKQMIADGVDILDIGGQSTRPNADEVPLEEELQRVVPVIEALRQQGVETPISVDTYRSQVAEVAIAAGADWVNDISGARFDPEMLSTVAQLRVPIILMHSRGTPKTMQTLTEYEDLIGEMMAVLSEQIQRAIALGIQQIMIDPGIGFAKTYEQNLVILRELRQFQTLNCPILMGVSRKSFIGRVLNQPDPQKRVWGTAAACAIAIANGADVIRVHDVAEMHDVRLITDAIIRNT